MNETLPRSPRGPSALGPLVTGALLLAAVALAGWLVFARGNDDGRQADSTTSAPGIVRLSDRLFDFGDVEVGQRSAPRDVTVVNDSDAAVRVGEPLLRGPAAPEFALDPARRCADASLAPGESCVVSVWFEPRAAKDRSAMLLLPLGTDQEPRVVQLRGTGVGAAIPVVEAATLDFGEQELTAPTTVREVALANVGNLPLSLRSLRVDGPAKSDYQVGKGGCAKLAVLAAGARCTLQISFKPTAAGQREARLVVARQADGLMTVGIHGIGGSGASELRAGLSPAILDFGSVPLESGGGRTGVATVTNRGAAGLMVAWIAVVGGADADFAVVDGGSCAVGREVASGGSCTVRVGFAPTEPGARVATLVVATNAQTFSEARLKGRGQAPSAG